MVFIVTACSFARSFPAPTVSALLGEGGTAGSDDPNPPTPHGEHDEEEPTVLGGPDGAATMFPMEVVDVSRDPLRVKEGFLCLFRLHPRLTDMVAVGLIPVELVAKQRNIPCAP